jgi:hypothetical protein
MNWPPLEWLSVVAMETFTRLVRFALGYAFDPRRVQGIDFLAALPLLLMTHRLGQQQWLSESRLPVRIAGDLAPDVAHHAAEITCAMS